VRTTIASPKLVYTFKGFDIEGGKAALRLTSTLLANLLDLILNRDRELVAANFAHPLLIVVVAAAFLFQDGSSSVVLHPHLMGQVLCHLRLIQLKLRSCILRDRFPEDQLSDYIGALL
jgi:hypothetical protein